MKLPPYSKESSTVPLLILGALLILIPGFLYFTYSDRTYTTGDFLAEYLDTTKTIQELEKAIFLPGSGSNTIRIAIYTQLEQVLVETESNSERLSAAKLGLENAELLEKQIILAKNTQHKLEGTLPLLERSIPKHPKESKESAEYAFSLISDYNDSSKEALSYLTYMNNETVKIFTDVINTDGDLTDDLITTFNNEIPEAEHAFDSLSFAYRKLIDTRKEISSQSDRLIKALSIHNQ